MHYYPVIKKYKEECMNIILKVVCVLFISVMPISICAEELLRDHAEYMNEIEMQCYMVIDDMFDRACTSVINKEDMSDYVWFKHANVDEIRNLLSDALVHSFDCNEPDIIPAKIDAYVQKKIRNELQRVVDHNVDIDGLKQFLAASSMLCDVSGVSHCKELVRTIKDENRALINELKMHREVQQREAYLARENILSKSEQ